VGLDLVVERHDGTTVVTVAGEIDMATAAELGECLVGTQGHVIVDLRGVSFLDASGIGTLASARNQLLETGGDLRLRKPQGMVRKVLEVTGLASWIED
jgi:anti-sigma B factor antagonist